MRRNHLTVFVSSTSSDLAPHRVAAQDVILDRGWLPVLLPEHGTAEARSVLEACRRKVGECDLVVILVAYRLGSVPGPEDGGDGERSLVEWEHRAAVEEGVPVLAFLAGEEWPVGKSERDPVRRERVEGFRAELERRPVVFFPPEPPPHATFRARLKEALVDHAAPGPSRPGPAASDPWGEAHLREPTPPDPPTQPYPVLDPYRHPATLGGRDAELETLLSRLARRKLVLGLHAPSGAGKSSLLLAGLLPRLRGEGTPVALVRHPEEPGIAGKLVRRLLAVPPGAELDDADRDGFVRAVVRAATLAGTPPVLVLDQFEDCLRPARARRDGADGRAERDPVRPALARLGPLIAATAAAEGPAGGPPCRWLLAYREDSHGEVKRWLQDVLAEARRAGTPDLERLPTDLSDAERFHDWSLPLFASGADPDAAFLDAISKPLSLPEAERPWEPWELPEDERRRLARAFAEARRRQPEAPLVPELQVVLAHLLAEAADDAEHLRRIRVPEDVDARIDHALADHLRRALDGAFPLEHRLGAARQARSRAVLALRRLADAAGRRSTEGLPEEELKRALGSAGADADEILRTLASPRVRVVVPERRPSGLHYRLSHDRLAALVLEVFDDEALQRELGLDQRELALRRQVERRTELFLAGDRAALQIDRRLYRRVERARPVVVWGGEEERWWRAWRRERRRQRLKVAAVAVAASMVMLLGAYLLWVLPDQREFENGLTNANPQSLFRSLDGPLTLQPLRGWTAGRLAAAPELLVARGFTEGPFAYGKQERRRALLRVAGRLVGEEAVIRRVRVFGAMAAALDDVRLRESALAGRAEREWRELRRTFIGALGREPPATPADRPCPLSLDEVHRGPEDACVRIPAGTLPMGSPIVAGLSREGTVPHITGFPMRTHESPLSGFWIQTHEVTNREYGLFLAAHRSRYEGADRPVNGVDWFQAAAYAAWAGGALPTADQWEFAARGEEGREYPWPANRGEPKPELAVYGQEAPERVGSRPLGATPEGVQDMAGNVSEWCRDWFWGMEYSSLQDPPGLPLAWTRLLCGGSFASIADHLPAVMKVYGPPEDQDGSVGFRVVWPSPGAPRGP